MSARQGIHTDDLEQAPDPATEVLAVVRQYGARVAQAGDPSAGYDDVRLAIFALAGGQPLPTPAPRAADIFADPGPGACLDPGDAMRAVLHANRRVKQAQYPTGALRGAATHTGAALLAELRAAGLGIAPLSPEPTEGEAP